MDPRSYGMPLAPWERNVRMRILALGYMTPGQFALAVGVRRQNFYERVRTIPYSALRRRRLCVLLVLPEEALMAEDPTVVGSVPVPRREGWQRMVARLDDRKVTPEWPQLWRLVRGAQ